MSPVDEPRGMPRRSASTLKRTTWKRCRRLVVVLGDQLSTRTAMWHDLDKSQDVVLMMETDLEQQHTPSHRMRSAVFLSAMRHFAIELQDDGWRVRYARLDDDANTQTFSGEVHAAVESLNPDRIDIVEPGEWRIAAMIDDWSESLNITVHPDDHFTCSLDEFRDWLGDKVSPVMEYFYRHQRKRLGILIDDDGAPTGGQWNYDHDNRESFKRAPRVPKDRFPAPDEITREVLALVQERFPDLPGRCDPDKFFWPVTRSDALQALEDFIEHRLPLFGKYEDAMWTGEAVLYHSRLSVPLNLKLLDPRECVDAALHALKSNKAPLPAVEGFVRQLIGWREFIRGIYWTQGPDYRDRNSLDEHGHLPDFYWSGDTDMTCMRECLQPVLDHAWCHHIPRLMVLGAFAMMSGVRPRALGDWFYGMFADSVDWVTTPNTIGMAMHADGHGKVRGVVGTKPYAASGKYIQRMSNYCEHCRYDVQKRHGEDACPYNVFYWDFLHRHRPRLEENARMRTILKSLDRWEGKELTQITTSAMSLRQRLGITPETDSTGAGGKPASGQRRKGR